MRIIIFVNIACFIFIGSIFFLHHARQKQSVLTVEQPTMQEDMLIYNMHLQEKCSHNQTVHITAEKSAVTKMTNIIQCSGITGILRKKNDTIAFFKATQAKIDHAQHCCYLSENVTATIRSITITASQGIFDITKKELTLEGGVTTEFAKEPDTPLQR